MIAPKTPLPWGTSQHNLRAVGSVDPFARITDAVAAFKDPDDAAYAVHAANVLPEVVAALREIVEAKTVARKAVAMTRARAALAKADAP